MATIFDEKEYNKITYQVRGAAFNVYSALGPGLLESVYQEAMIYELRERGLEVKSQDEVPIVYNGHLLGTHLRLDLIVEDTVILELKSVDELKPVFFKQLLSYLKLAQKPVGYLINFNTDDIMKSMHRIKV